MKLHVRGAMRQIDTPLPNLGESRGLYRGFASTGWIPRNTFARVGVFIFGATFVIGALSMIAASILLKSEIQASIPSPGLGFLVSFFAVMAVLCVAFWLLWFGRRLLMSCFRHSTIRK